MPSNKQIERRLKSGYIIDPRLPLEIIDKIWKEVERAQDALARGRHKLYMWAMYNFSLIDYLAETRIQTAGGARRLYAERKFWARCLRERRLRQSVGGEPGVFTWID